MKYFSAAVILAVCFASANAGYICTLCENELSTLLNNSTLHEFMTNLQHQLCPSLPASYRPACNLFFDIYGEQVIKQILSKTPAQYCTMAKLCAASKEVQFNQADCDGCKIGVGALQGILGSEAIQDALADLINNGICTLLPGDAVQQCKLFVTQFFPQIMNAITAVLNDQLLCVDTGVCPGK